LLAKSLGVKTDPASPSSVASQIADQIRRRIASGALLPGEQLPSVPTLARESGTSTFPVAQAFQRLQREGLLVARAGAGTYVASSLSERRRVIHVMLHPPVLNDQLEAFRKEHPEYSVVTHPYQAPGPELDRLLAAPNPLDLVSLDSEGFAHLAASGRLSVIKEPVDDGNQDTLVNVERMFEFGGQRLGVTLTVLPFILSARKSVFDGCGEPLPSPDWTGEEMLALAERLTLDRNGDGALDQFGYLLTQRAFTWYALFRAVGGGMDSWQAITGPESRVAARRVWEAVHKRHISPPHIAGALGRYGDMLMAAAETARVAMLLTDLHSFRECRERFGEDIVPLRSPRTPSGARSSMSFCWGVGIPKRATCREGALALIRFFRTAQVQRGIASGYRVLPARLSLWEEAAGGDERLAWLLLKEMSAARPMTESDLPGQMAEAYRALDRLIRGLILPEEYERALDEMGVRAQPDGVGAFVHV